MATSTSIDDDAAAASGLAVAGLPGRRLRLFARARMGGRGRRRHATPRALQALARRPPRAWRGCATTRSCSPKPIGPRAPATTRRFGESPSSALALRRLRRAAARDDDAGRRLPPRDRAAWPCATVDRLRDRPGRADRLSGRGRRRGGGPCGCRSRRRFARLRLRPSSPTSSRPAIRLGTVGQTDGQRVTRRARSRAVEAARGRRRSTPPSTISAAPPSAPTSRRMRHETQYTRLFRS